MRRAFTLVELLTVVAIIALLAAILFPVFAQAREKARQTQCLSNLKEMGIALTMYRENYDGVNSRQRSCPDLGNGTCATAGPTLYTGANETWWAPYDPRLGAGAAEPADFSTIDYNTDQRRGFLQPYVKNLDIFHCPDYPKGQVGYAMSYIQNGPVGKPDGYVVNPAVNWVWDHARTPGCANTGPPTPTDYSVLDWFPVGTDTTHTHYPFRHQGGFNILRYDGSAKWRKPSDLKNTDFYADQVP